MLRKLEREEFGRYIDQAYQWALIPEYTSYPVYYDGVKTREEYIEMSLNSFDRDKEEILLYLEEGKCTGWIHYRILPEDFYLDVKSLSTAGNTEEALEEFIDYITEKYPDDSIYLGFPAENRRAIDWLSQHGFGPGEQSYNNVLLLKDADGKCDNTGIEEIGADNYDVFAAIHRIVEDDMYWNSRRIREHLDEWLILAYGNKAAIYCMKSMAKDDMAEIFGLDFADGQYDSEIFTRLLKCVVARVKQLDSGSLVMFGEEHEQADILKAGFHCIGKYMLMMREK